MQFAVHSGRLYVIEANPRASRTVPFVSKAIGLPLAKLACRIMLGEQIADLDLPEDPMQVEHISVKEAVLPFDRFDGADAILGPEMRSTGEVMGVARDFPTAFAKAQAAAGAALPTGGTAFITVTDRDKPGAVAIAQTLHDLGFRIVATRGTKEAIERMGIPALELEKVGEGSPNVVDWIENGDVDLVVNTPTGSGARTDGWQIRRAAITRGIPCLTTLSGGLAAARAIAAARSGEAEVLSLQELHRGRSIEAPRVSRRGDRVAGAARAAAADGLGTQRARRVRRHHRARPGRSRAAAGPVLHARRRRALGRGRGRAAVPAACVLGRARGGARARVHARGRRAGDRAACGARAGRRALGPRAAGARLRAAGAKAGARCSAAAASASPRSRSSRTRCARRRAGARAARVPRRGARARRRAACTSRSSPPTTARQATPGS